LRMARGCVSDLNQMISHVKKTWGRIAGRVRRARNKHGTAGMFVHVLKWRFPLSRNCVFCTQEIRPCREMGGLAIKRCRALSDLTPGELAPILEYAGEHTREAYAGLFANGAELWLGSWDGTAAGACWSHRYGRETSDFFVPLRETDVRILFCFVFPAFRGRGIYPKMIRTMADTLLAEGAASIYIDCRSWNHASIRGIRKAEFYPFAEAWELAIGRKKWILRRTLQAVESSDERQEETGR